MKIVILNLIKKFLFMNLNVYHTADDIKNYLEENNIIISKGTVLNYMKFLINFGLDISVIHNRNNKYYFVLNSKEIDFFKN